MSPKMTLKEHYKTLRKCYKNEYKGPSTCTCPSLRDLLIHICRPLVKPIIIAGTDDYIVDVVNHSFLGRNNDIVVSSLTYC